MAQDQVTDALRDVYEETRGRKKLPEPKKDTRSNEQVLTDARKQLDKADQAWMRADGNVAEWKQKEQRLEEKRGSKSKAKSRAPKKATPRSSKRKTGRGM